MTWPNAGDGETFAPVADRENHRLDVYLQNGEVADVRLDDASVWPVWFKLEWKGNGELSAKVRGVRLSSRLGDTITLHEGAGDRPR